MRTLPPICITMGFAVSWLWPCTIGDYGARIKQYLACVTAICYLRNAGQSEDCPACASFLFIKPD
jgi:hypothetical protein